MGFRIDMPDFEEERDREEEREEGLPEPVSPLVGFLREQFWLDSPGPGGVTTKTTTDWLRRQTGIGYEEKELEHETPEAPVMPDRFQFTDEEIERRAEEMGVTPQKLKGAVEKMRHPFRVDEDRIKAAIALDSDRVGGRDEEVSEQLGVSVEELRRLELMRLPDDEFHNVVSMMHEDISRFDPGLRKAIYEEKLVRRELDKYRSLQNVPFLLGGINWAERVAGFRGILGRMSKEGLRPTEEYPGQTGIRERARFRLIQEDEHTLRRFLTQWGPEAPRFVLGVVVIKKLLKLLLGPGGSYVGMENLWNKLPDLAKAAIARGGTFAARTGLEMDKDWSWQERATRSFASGGLGATIGVSKGLFDWYGVAPWKSGTATIGGLAGLSYASHRDLETALGQTFMLAGMYAVGGWKKGAETKALSKKESDRFMRAWDLHMKKQGLDPDIVSPKAKSKFADAIGEMRIKIGELIQKERAGKIKPEAAAKKTSVEQMKSFEKMRPQMQRMLEDVAKQMVDATGYSPEAFKGAQKLLAPPQGHKPPVGEESPKPVTKDEPPVVKQRPVPEPMKPDEPEPPEESVPIPDEPPKTVGDKDAWDYGFETAIEKTMAEDYQKGDVVKPLPSDIADVEQKLGREMTDIEKGHFIEGFKLALGGDYEPLSEFPSAEGSKELETFDAMQQKEIQELGEFFGIEMEGKTSDEVLTDAVDAFLKKDTGHKPEVVEPFEKGLRDGFDSKKIYAIPPDRLEFDPERFQHRHDVDERGITDKFDDVEVWDPWAGTGAKVYYDGEKFWTTDGHHRGKLLLRLIEEGGKVREWDSEKGEFAIRDIEPGEPFPAFVLDVKEGWTEKQAIAEAVLSNLKGESVDAWSVTRALRTSGVTMDDIKDAGLSPKQREVKAAVGMTKLSDEAFTDALQRDVDPGQAAKVGELLGDRETEIQIQALRELEQAQYKTVTEAEGLVRRIGRAKDVEQTTMFGKELKNTHKLKNDVEKAVLDKIREDKRAMVADPDRIERQARAEGVELSPEEAEEKAREQGDTKHASVVVADLLENVSSKDLGGPIEQAITEGYEVYSKLASKKGLESGAEKAYQMILDTDIREAYPDLVKVTPGLVKSFERYQKYVDQRPKKEGRQTALTEAEAGAAEATGAEVREGTTPDEYTPPDPTKSTLSVAPSIRKYAKEMGVPERVLTEYVGTGKKGAWTKADVDRFVRDGEVKYGTDMGHELFPFGADPPRRVAWLPETQQDVGRRMGEIKTEVMKDYGDVAEARPDQSRLAKQALDRQWIDVDLGDRYAHYNPSLGEIAVNKDLIDKTALADLQTDVMRAFGIRDVTLPEKEGKSLSEVLMPTKQDATEAFFQHERGHAQVLAQDDGRLADAADRAGELEKLADLHAMQELGWTADNVIEPGMDEVPRKPIEQQAAERMELREKANRRMHAIANKFGLSRDQRILTARQVMNRPELDSTKDLSTSELIQFADYLAEYQDYMKKPVREPTEEEMKFNSASEPEMQRILEDEQAMDEARNFAQHKIFDNEIREMESEYKRREVLGGRRITENDIRELFGKELVSPEQNEFLGHLFEDMDGLYMPDRGTVEKWTIEDIRDALKRPNIFSFFRPARHMLPEGSFQEALPARNAALKYSTDMEKHRREIMKGLHKEDRRQVSMMLENIIPKEGELGQVAQRLRDEVLDPLHQRLVEVGVLDQNQYVEDYFPHVKKMFQSITGSSLDVPSRWFAHERTGDLADYKKDAGEVIDMYISAASKALFLDPWLDKWSPVFEQMDPHQQRFIEGFVDHVYGRPSWDEQLIDNAIKDIWQALGKTLGKDWELPEGKRISSDFSRMATSLAIQNLMGFNVGSIMKNFFQKLHGVADVATFKQPLRGMRLWAKAEKMRHTPSGREFLEKFCTLKKNRTFTAGLEKVGDYHSRMNQVLDATSKATMFGFKWQDMHNIETSFLMKWLANMEDGLSIRDNLMSSNDTASRTQFEYGIGKPPIMRGPLGRAVGALGQWPAHYAEMWMDWGGEKGWGKIPLLIGITAGAYYLMRRLGFQVRMGPMHTFDSHLLTTLATGQDLPLVGKASDVAGAMQRLLEADEDTMTEAIIELGEEVLPGGVKATRLRRFKNASEDNWQLRDRAGRVYYRYELDGPFYEMFGVPGEAVRHMMGETPESYDHWYEVYPPWYGRLWRFMTEDEAADGLPLGLPDMSPDAGPDVSPDVRPR